MLINRKQLEWRCRRGVRELDVLLSDFLDKDFAGLNAQEQATFAQFLEQQDPIIMDWLFGRATPDEPKFIAIVERLQHRSGL